MGFVIAKDMSNHVKTYKYVTDRVGYIELELKHKNTDVKYRIINCYGQTSKNAKKRPNETENFYNEITNLTKIGGRNEVLICGDFNAKLGKWHEDSSLIRGKHGHGRKNDAGERLETFMSENSLFACNTAFQHAAKHKTTWSARKVDKNGQKVTYYNQIDFILCRQRSKAMLVDSRSHTNTSLYSDHKPVTATLELQGIFLKYKHQKANSQNFNLEKLVKECQARREFQHKIR